MYKLSINELLRERGCRMFLNNYIKFIAQPVNHQRSMQGLDDATFYRHLSYI